MSQSIITNVEVRGLFNRFSYNLPSNAIFTHAAILYGDNGVGKSTILRLVFHLLSASGNRGHRTALKSVAFELLSVNLSSGVLIKAERRKISDTHDDSLTGPIALTIERNGKLLAEWLYAQERQPGSWYGSFDLEENVVANSIERYLISSRPELAKLIPASDLRKIFNQGDRSPPSDDVKRGEKAYLEVLAEVSPTTFYVNAERRLDSDAVSDPSDELELRRAITHNEPKRINDLVNRAREIALSQALVSASKWVQQRAVRSTNQGSTNVHSVYANVLEHLSNDYSKTEGNSRHAYYTAMVERLGVIEDRTKQLAEYELSTSLDMSVFKASLMANSNEQRDLSAELINPYLESVSSRLAALDQIYRTLDRFVKTINGFLTGKKVSYKLTRGFSIDTESGSLEPSQLSSGEQQLLLMFCYALTARERPSVFMIDEPEISLNVKWQRQLLQSLIEITAGSEIQFILASHSLELISQHRSRVVKLENNL